MTDKYRTWALTLLVCLISATAQADIKVTSRLVNTAAHGVGADTLELVTYVKGSWLRRETHGTGMLAELLGKRVEILNRADGKRITLDTETKTFTVDAVPTTACGDHDLADLRHLGRRQRSAAMQVNFPDTMSAVLGFALTPMQLELPSPGLSEGVGTIIRFWLCTAYEEALGPAYVDDLFCGDTEAKSDWAGVLHAQFGFSDDVAKSIRNSAAGFPLKLEILSGLAGGLKGTTTIEAVALEHEPLPQTLFAAPEDFDGPGSGAN